MPLSIGGNLYVIYKSDFCRKKKSPLVGNFARSGFPYFYLLRRRLFFFFFFNLKRACLMLQREFIRVATCKQHPQYYALLPLGFKKKFTRRRRRKGFYFSLFLYRLRHITTCVTTEKKKKKKPFRWLLDLSFLPLILVAPTPIFH